MRKEHNEPCYYCGKPINTLSCNPSDWPVTLCHPDEPGVVKFHHTGCVSERLEAAEIGLMAERARCLKAVDDEPEWNPTTHHYMPDMRYAKKNIRKRIEEHEPTP